MKELDKLIEITANEFGIPTIVLIRGTRKDAKLARRALCYIARVLHCDMDTVAATLKCDAKWCDYLSKDADTLAKSVTEFNDKLNNIRKAVGLPPRNYNRKPCIGWRYTAEEELRMRYAIHSSVLFMRRYSRY